MATDPQNETLDFTQIQWDAQLDDDWRHLVRLSVREDLERSYDWTTVALVPENARAKAYVVAREKGVAAGLAAARTLFDEMQTDIAWSPYCEDGASLERGVKIAEISGNARDMLTAERPLLNLIGRLSGIASLTRQFVDRIEGCKAKLYDTRKTLPGYRRLEKYAVRCGGGRNHRTGLFDAILIKDNHLAFRREHGGEACSPADAVRIARELSIQVARDQSLARPMIVEVEVDSLEQLKNVLHAAPDIVLLDNMAPDQLREAVSIRDSFPSKAQLEASGGIRLDTVRNVALTGVDRISCGAVTHSAVCLDVALDWE